MMNKEQNSEKREKALRIGSVTHRCTFKKYGDVEKRCLKCDYIIPFDADIDDSIVLENMIKSGYPLPDCSNGG